MAESNQSNQSGKAESSSELDGGDMSETEQITPFKARQKILRLLKLMKSTLYLQSDQNAETAENATTQAEQLLRKTASKALSEAAYKCESLFELVEYAHELLDFEKWE